MDYHHTPAEMDLARQMRDVNLDWPYGIGDHFCTLQDIMYICLEISGQNGDIQIVSHQDRFPLIQVYWLPKRSQAMQWFLERGWKLVIQTNERMTRMEAINPHTGDVIEGLGKTEMEALYDTMLRVLELNQQMV